jgi:hypothetical protein
VENLVERKVISLYSDSTIVSYKTVFNITSYVDLNHFKGFFKRPSDELILPILENIVEIAHHLLEKYEHTTFDIIYEHSKDYHYFTVWNDKFIWEFLRSKNVLQMDYEYSDERFSVRIKR